MKGKKNGIRNDFSNNMNKIENARNSKSRKLNEFAN